MFFRSPELNGHVPRICNLMWRTHYAWAACVFFSWSLEYESWCLFAQREASMLLLALLLTSLREDQYAIY